jgi:hypothetical protein
MVARVDAAYRQVRDRIFALTLRTSAPDPELVVAEMARLRALAERIKDPLWQQRALTDIERLPRTLSTSLIGHSPAYAEAATLVAELDGLEGPPGERLAEVRRIAQRLGELAEEAPGDEARAIRGMSESVARTDSEIRSRR